MKTKPFKELTDLFAKIKVQDKTGKALSLDKAADGAIRKIAGLHKKGNKVFLIGNGGSSSIASHISIDLLKNVGVASLAFNDASLLTCISNDLGYDCVFEKPIEMLAQKGDFLIAISSSGRSKNILRAVSKAQAKGCFLMTLSGFSQDNPLRKMGNLNFYIPSDSYGSVEIVHLSICHMVVDGLMLLKERG